jgi:hypothetical protein
MNLALHSGWLGVVEAGLIAFVIGLIAFAFWHGIARWLQWPHGRAFGWASLTATVIGAGIDLWHLLTLFLVNPGSPAYVRQALAGIHDPEYLGARTLLEILGAFAGVASAWTVFEARASRHD